MKTPTEREVLTHEENLQKVDNLMAEAEKRIAAARKKLAAADRKFRTYTRPEVHP